MNHSNTTVDLFVQYARVSPTLTSIAANGKALRLLEDLPGDARCPLRLAADLCRDLTAGLREHSQVHSTVGSVKAALRCDNKWQVTISTGGKFRSVTGDMLYLCTGSLPRQFPLDSAKDIDLITALKPSALCKSVPFGSTVAVVGNSHSALLVLKNLYDLQTRPSRVVHYARHPFKYAEQKDGWILYDNTGLKGVAAEFAKDVLDTDDVDWPGYMRVDNEEDFKAALREAASATGSVHVIGAVGFERFSLPEITYRSKMASIVHDKQTGHLLGPGATIIPGLFGFGIAFPELCTDPYGNKENNVGLWDFMAYVRRAIPMHLHT